MRLVQVAKALGMTGQQLRKELEAVDFGVKPTDREIPENLAQGVVRYMARKHNIDVDMDALGFSLEEDGGAGKSEGGAEEEQEEEAEESAPADEEEPQQETDQSKESLNVLRKLTLDDVPKEAIQKQEATLSDGPSKEEKAEIEREEKAMDKAQQKKSTPTHQEQIKKKEGTVWLPEQVTVKEFAEKAGVQVPVVVQALMKNGIMATVTQTIDFDTAAIVASELGVDVQKEQGSADAEHLLSRNLDELLKDDPAHLVERPPVVVVMGHVDHGKTAILDAIRETNVMGGEAGGITQHIGAYQITHNEKNITFLDTPGHEAFASMRARGSQITDIAIIVVAADDGVMPTTVEAIHHAQDAGVPILVVINKVDLPSADPDKVKGELAGHGLQPEDWGGQTPVVQCSASTKQGISDVLDHILLLAEIEELRGNPDRLAVATVIESHLDSSLGPLASVVVNTGTLRRSDAFVCGQTYGKVRTMIDAVGVRHDAVGLSAPVRVSGFNDVPNIGDILQVASSEKEARVLLEQLQEMEESRKKRSFADLVSRLSEGKMTQLKVVLKADTQGTLEALQDSLAKLSTDEVTVKVIHAGIGNVSETDVMMAAASEGVCIAFHVGTTPDVERTAEREGVKVRKYDVVYALLEDVEGLVKGLVEPEEEEQILGHLEVKEVFMTKRNEQVVGGKVLNGTIKRLPFRILRGEDDEDVGGGRITSLRKVDKDIKEAPEGSECGMRVETNPQLQAGDVLEVYLREFKKK